MFKVGRNPCKQCLLSKNKIVSDERRAEILKECLSSGTHFICHKASIDDKDICCAGFFAKFKNDIPKIQIFERLGMIKKVDI